MQKKYNHFKDTTFAGMERQTYVEAASVEAERAQGLVEKLIWLEGWVSDRHGGDNPISKEIRDTLNKYNQPK